MDEQNPEEKSNESEVLKLFDREERSYFKRVSDMAKGLTAPRESLEFREAKNELQRQWAPLVAITLPLIVIIVMCSITIGSAAEQTPVVQTVIEEPVEAEPLEEVEPPEPPPEMQDTPEEIMDSVLSDVPSPPIGEVTAETPTLNPPLQMTPSPRTLKAVPARGSGGGGIGGGTRLEGDMVGMFIDLSKDSNGNFRPEFTRNQNNKDAMLYKDILSMVEKGFTKEAFAPYHVVPQRVYLSHLALPYVESAIGPSTYKVEKSVKAGAPWAAIYKGQLQPEESGTYRLAGLYDDILVVRVDGKEVLEFTWSSRNNGANQPTPIGTGWVQKDAAVAGKHKMRGFQNVPLTYGDWFELRADKPVSIEILIADNGGDASGKSGLTGGIILLEKKGETYEKTPDGVPLLPVFATTRLTFAERQRLAGIADPTNKQTSGHYAFRDRNVPVMNTCGKASLKMPETQIEVDIGDL